LKVSFPNRREKFNMSKIERIIEIITRWLNWIAATALIAVMVIVCANVVGRGFFAKPVKGTVEIVGLLGGVIIAWAISYTQMIKGHIRIDLFMERLPPRIQYIVDSLMYLFSLLLFCIISWQSFLFAKSKSETGELSEVLKMPITTFAYVVAIGCFALTLVLLLDLIKSILKVIKK